MAADSGDTLLLKVQMSYGRGGCQLDQQHRDCWTVVLHTELGKFICVYCEVTVTAV